MGIVIHPHPAKLVTGIITSSEEISIKAEKVLEKAFGPIDYKSRTMRFDFTSYYEKEMGPDLKRFFLSFKKLIDPARLAQIKHITNRLERQISYRIKTGSRAVNIDPGYLSDAKLVLASTKDHYHRIYLNKDIYAEVTLYYRNGSFKYSEWTYPDYRTDAYLDVFNHIRSIYMQQRRR